MHLNVVTSAVLWGRGTFEMLLSQNYLVVYEISDGRGLPVPEGLVKTTPRVTNWSGEGLSGMVVGATESTVHVGAGLNN